MTKALTVRTSFETFHARPLGQFIPARQIYQLRAETYERAQFEGESLATYVQRITDAALMLRIREDEAEVVRRMVEGFTPAQRARFVSQAPRSSLLQLEQLAAVDRNIAYADRTRTIQAKGLTVGAVESHAQIRDSRPTCSQPSRVLKQGKPIVSTVGKPDTRRKGVFSVWLLSENRTVGMLVTSHDKGHRPGNLWGS